jgi:hypothetical protein
MSSSTLDTISGANGTQTHAASQKVFSNHFTKFCAARPQAEQEYNSVHDKHLDHIDVSDGWEGLTEQSVQQYALWEGLAHHLVFVAKKVDGDPYMFGTVEGYVNGLFEMARRRFVKGPTSPAYEFFQASDPNSRTSHRSWWVQVKTNIARACQTRAELLGLSLDRSVAPIGEVRWSCLWMRGRSAVGRSAAVPHAHPPKPRQ